LPDFVLIFGVIAVILTAAALASGLVERSPLSFPLMFLGLGFLLGSHGFDAIEIEPDAAVL
jgi:NhaP-type Na+/H+ or K+/H+ antiporter